MWKWISQRYASFYYWWFPLKAAHCEDLPDRLDLSRVYLVGDDGIPWSAAMLCPCGCGAVIRLSLVTMDRPSWRYRTGERGRITLAPSVWRTTGCRSHFFVRDGRIVWASPAPRSR